MLFELHPFDLMTVRIFLAILPHYIHQNNISLVTNNHGVNRNFLCYETNLGLM